MSWVLYDKYKQMQFGISGQAQANLATDTLKCILVTSSYTPAAASDQFVSTTGLKSNEVTAGSTYSAGGPTLAGVTVSNPVSDTITFSCNNLVIGQDASGFTNARYAILYKSTGTDSTSPLICYTDLGGNKSIQGGSLTLQIDAAGVFTGA